MGAGGAARRIEMSDEGDHHTTTTKRLRSATPNHLFGEKKTQSRAPVAQAGGGVGVRAANRVCGSSAYVGCGSNRWGGERGGGSPGHIGAALVPHGAVR
jgi:hypothetical protein